VIHPVRAAPLALALVAVGLLGAESGSASAADRAASEPDPPKKKKKKTKDAARAKRDEDGAASRERFEIHGRAIGRAELGAVGDAEPALDLSLASARAELRYRYEQWLRVVAEAELAGKPRVRDAYVRFRGGMLGLRGGYFKLPGSAVELESGWTLPTARRGLLHEAFDDFMQIGGRRPGFQIEFYGPGSLRPRAYAGVFQGSLPNGDLLEKVGAGSLNGGGRASLRLGPVEVGAFSQLRSTIVLADRGPERFWSAGADAKLDVDLGSWGGLRVWADGQAGSSWYDDDAFDDEDALFVAGRVVGGLRYGGLRKAEPYFEPFVAVHALDPDTRFTADLAFEIVGGINVGWWDLVRLTLELEHRSVDENFPPLFDETRSKLVDRKAVVLQLGAAF
jgi:hypothetical protein